MKRRNGSPAAALTLLALVAAAAGATAQTEAPADTVAAPRVEIGFGRDLDREARALVEPAGASPRDIERVWCLTRVVGLAAPATVTHVWYHAGQTRARVDLTVGSGDWRTWSSKRMLAGWTGDWEVKVLDADGTVLGAASFVLE
jgi:hypothetical protein